MSQNIYETITNTFIQQLEQGVRPWHQPWQSDKGNASYKIPVNAVTGKEYRGYNILSLWHAASVFEYPTNEYATYKQWASEGEFVRKDEKGNMIVFYDVMEKENEKHELKKIPFLKVSHVFNKSQLKSYDLKKEEKPELPPLFDRIERVDEFVKKTGVFIKHEGDQAYYNRVRDIVVMPKPELFTGTPTQTGQEGYYSTLFHEMGHLTGHANRLNREFGKRFGDKAYAYEELVAEITSAFMCAKKEITDAPREDHAQYLSHWIKVLREDNRAVITAASHASKATDFLETMREVSAPANDNCQPCQVQGVQLRRLS